MLKKGFMSFARSGLSSLFLLVGALSLPVQAAAPVKRARSAAKAGALAPGGYRWLEEGPLDGPIHLVISIDRQMAHVYSGDRLVGMASVSTGMAGHRTPTGDYPILQKNQWHRSNLYSNAPMPFMQRLTWDGIALHAGHNPGYPASHGCIRLPYAFAQKLFGMTSLGGLVTVTRDRLHPSLTIEQMAAADAVVKVAAPAPAKPVLDIDPIIFVPRVSRR